MVSVACSLNHQCDSVVPLPLGLVCSPWEVGQVKPYPPPSLTRQCVCCTQHQCGYKLKENFIMFDSAFLDEVLPRLA